MSPELPNSMQPVGWFKLGVCEWPTLGSPNSENFILPCWCWRWFILSIIISFKSSSSFCNSPRTLSWCSTTLIKSTILVPLVWRPYTSKPSLTKGLVNSSAEAATSVTTWNYSQQTSINIDDRFRKKIKQQNTQLTVLFVKLLLITLSPTFISIQCKILGNFVMCWQSFKFGIKKWLKDHNCHNCNQNQSKLNQIF